MQSYYFYKSNKYANYCQPNIAQNCSFTVGESLLSGNKLTRWCLYNV